MADRHGHGGGRARATCWSTSEAPGDADADGRAVVETDMTDIGTGTYTILAQVAGEMLGLPVDRVDVRLGDTDFPRGAGSGGSFGAAGSGSSVALACEEIIGRPRRADGCRARRAGVAGRHGDGAQPPRAADRAAGRRARSTRSAPSTRARMRSTISQAALWRAFRRGGRQRGDRRDARAADARRVRLRAASSMSRRRAARPSAA